MPATACTLICHCATEALEQLYTGFLLLHKRGLIRLSQHCTRDGVALSSEQHLRNSSGAHLRAIVDRQILVHYDVHDAADLHETNLERCDVYFKRSFSQRYVDQFPRYRNKVFPLGLNYALFPDSRSWHAIRRSLALGQGLRGKARLLLEALDTGNLLKYRPRLRHLEALPNYDLAPKVLFLAWAYDPYDPPDRSKEKIEEYIAVNETRARCLKLLRSELGSSLLGGFVPSPYAIKAYPQLVADRTVTIKKNYLQVQSRYPIGVASTGLHGSIGWKLAEYVATSKAIVSEKLNYQVPGDFRPGKNYLQFTSPEECAQACVRLVEDRDTRNALMLNNAHYYQTHVRPDSLVLNTLLQALSTVSKLKAETVNGCDRGNELQGNDAGGQGSADLGSGGAARLVQRHRRRRHRFG